MTLSYSKFMIGVTANLDVDISCTVCGHGEVHEAAIRLDDAIEWAELHECAPLRTT